MRWRLRTLLVLMAILPPLLAVGWGRYSALREAQRREAEWKRAERERIYNVTDESIRLPLPPMPR